MIFKDAELLSEAYKAVHCKCPKNCDCTKCAKKTTEKVEEAKKAKPDYFDADEDGNTKEPVKKALKDKAKKHVKESFSSFKDLYNSVFPKPNLVEKTSEE